MKKIIIALVCVIQMICMAMNSDDALKKKYSEMLQRNNATEIQVHNLMMEERKVKTLELLVASHALDTCLKVRSYNLRPWRGLNILNADCEELGYKFQTLEHEFHKNLGYDYVDTIDRNL